jgi:hypothetical protein
MEALMLDTLPCAVPAQSQISSPTFQAAAAAIAFDRIVSDCLEREWVVVAPKPNKARRDGRAATPPEREALA